MDAKLINPFVDAVSVILPQMGLQDISRSKVSVKEKNVKSLGITVLVGITKQVRGNVAYNMPEDTAKFIASTMMCGMPVESFDDMAQSALGELANMITATAATKLAELGFEVDISTPSISIGDGFSVKISAEQFLCIEMAVADKPLELNISLG